MAAKKVVISALAKDEEAVRKLLAAVKTYGLDTGGHFWIDDLQNMAWLGAAGEVMEPACGIWIIMGPAEELAKPSIRTGLSLAAIAVQAARGLGFPIIVMPTAGSVDPATLPTVLRGADVLPPNAPSLGVKLTAKANMPVPASSAGYRLNVHGLPGIGLWLEAGPAKGHAWQGAMLGTQGGEIASQGVGPAGEVPERCTLEYPMQGLKLASGEREFTAWAVQNAIDDQTSHFVWIKGNPEALIFGPLPEGDDAEVYTVILA